MRSVAVFFRLVLLLMIILACAAVVGMVWAGDQLPRMAARSYGPPGGSLSYLQRTLYSARVLAMEPSLLSPHNPAGAGRSFSVSLGETVNAIAGRLEEEGFIGSADAFRTYLIYAGLDTGVQAGRYLLSSAMTPVEIARTLQDAVPAEVDFVILPGWRAEEIAMALPTSGLDISALEFLKLVRNPTADMLPEGFPALASLEGFLMPGTYQVKREISAYDLVRLFIQRFDQTVTPDLREAFAANGLALEEAVSLAAIVQREAMIEDEQPIIASVFYNRLADGMKLDSDPTVQYAAGYQVETNNWWKNPLTRADLQFDSRYNTYIYPGLPPGPICNPSIEALRAVAYPAETGYYYFRAKCDGSRRHAFSVTYDEHLQNACP